MLHPLFMHHFHLGNTGLPVEILHLCFGLIKRVGPFTFEIKGINHYRHTVKPINDIRNQAGCLFIAPTIYLIHNRPGHIKITPEHFHIIKVICRCHESLIHSVGIMKPYGICQCYFSWSINMRQHPQAFAVKTVQRRNIVTPQRPGNLRRARRISNIGHHGKKHLRTQRRHDNIHIIAFRRTDRFQKIIIKPLGGGYRVFLSHRIFHLFNRVNHQLDPRFVHIVLIRTTRNQQTAHSCSRHKSKNLFHSIIYLIKICVSMIKCF